MIEGELEDFTFVEINGMRLTEPAQVFIFQTILRFPIYEIKIFHFFKAYSALWRALSGGQKVTSAHARDLLDARFSGAAEEAERKRRKGKRAEEGGAVVVLVDELDKVGTGLWQFLLFLMILLKRRILSFALSRSDIVLSRLKVYLFHSCCANPTEVL